MKLDSSAFVADPALVQALEQRATPVDCTQDRLLFRQGDAPTGLFIFHNGEVVLSMNAPNGQSIVKITAAPGSLLGLPGLVSNQGYSLSAKARRGAQISFLNRDTFSKLMLSEPSLSMMILRVLAAEVRTARQALSKD